VKIRQRHSLGRTVHCEPGDQLVCTVQDRKTKEEITFRETVGRAVEINTVVTIDVSDELGLIDGFGGVFGKASPCPLTT